MERKAGWRAVFTLRSWMEMAGVGVQLGRWHNASWGVGAPVFSLRFSHCAGR